MQMALRQNLSLISSRLAADIARENVRLAEGGHGPSVRVIANHFRNTANGESQFPAGSSAGGSATDETARGIGLQVTFLLFSGGAVSSKFRQAVYLQRAA